MLKPLTSESRFEAQGVVMVLREDKTLVVDNKKVSLYKRETSSSKKRTECHDKARNRYAPDCGECEGCRPKPSPVDEDARSQWHGTVSEVRDLGNAVEALLQVAEPGTAPTLNASEPRLDGGAEGPDPKDGEVIVQMAVEKFGEILDLTNSLIENKLTSYSKSEADGLRLAQLVSTVFGGRSVFP